MKKCIAYFEIAYLNTETLCKRSQQTGTVAMKQSKTFRAPESRAPESIA